MISAKRISVQDVSSGPSGHRRRIAQVVALSLLAMALPALAKKQKHPDTGTVATQVPVVIVPNKHDAAQASELTSENVIVKEDYKPMQVLDWRQLPKEQSTQLVILIDDSLQARSSLQFDDLKKFIMQLPPPTQVAIGYMEDGRTAMASDFRSDRLTTAKSLRLPTGIIGVDASPYFCLSDLAKRWPDNGHPAASRQVLMITDGIDRYFSPRQYNPEDPYVETAISDAQKNHLIVSSIYFRDLGFVDRGINAAFVGSDYLLQLANGTGGMMYSLGVGDPVTFVPFLEDYSKRLASQYIVTFLGHGTGLQSIEVSTKVHDVKLDAPRAVIMGQQVLSAPQMQLR